MLMVCGISMNSAQGIDKGVDLQHCIRVLVEHYLKLDIHRYFFNNESVFRDIYQLRYWILKLFNC